MVGKIVGLVLGLMSGGFLGALLGLWIGHWFDRSFLGVRPGGGILGGTGKKDQQQILIHCFELLGSVCKADGQVTRVEIQSAEALMQRLKVGDDQRQDLIKAFNRGKTTGFDVDRATTELRSLCKGRVLWVRLALEIVLTGALADGQLDSAEREMLGRIAAGLGFRPADFDALLNLMTGASRGWQGAGSGGGRATGPSPAQQQEEAYRTLGVAASASNDEVRKAYRRLMSQHHPDKLANRDMPPALRAQAEERVRDIRAAWDHVKQIRGL